MGAAVGYELSNGVAVIRIDDGKRNALSPAVLKEIYAALDRAEADRAQVILTGRQDVFSAGFDLKVMKRGGPEALKMLRLGYSMTARVLAYPYPVTVACSGHSFAMGVFLMLSADHIIGTDGDFKISANEVAIGLTMPRVAAAMLKHRLNPSAYQRAVTLSTAFNVSEALNVGFFDEVVSQGELMDTARSRVKDFAALDTRAHRESKRRIRRGLIWKIRFCVWLDLLDAIRLGMRGTKPR